MEEKASYQAGVQSLLKDETKPVMMEGATLDLQQFERLLIPLLNWVRKEQGKKPVIVPK